MIDKYYDFELENLIDEIELPPDIHSERGFETEPFEC